MTNKGFLPIRKTAESSRIAYIDKEDSSSKPLPKQLSIDFFMKVYWFLFHRFLQYFQILVFYFLFHVLMYLGFKSFKIKIEGRHLFVKDSISQGTFCREGKTESTFLTYHYRQLNSDNNMYKKATGLSGQTESEHVKCFKLYVMDDYQSLSVFRSFRWQTRGR